MSGELERYTRDLPKKSRQRLEDTLTDALDARFRDRAIWDLGESAIENFIRVETRRRELVGDDSALAQVTGQFMAAACAKAKQNQENQFGGLF
jgi:hypothetical protein